MLTALAIYLIFGAGLGFGLTFSAIADCGFNNLRSDIVAIPKCVLASAILWPRHLYFMSKHGMLRYQYKKTMLTPKSRPTLESV